MIVRIMGVLNWCVRIGVKIFFIQSRTAKVMHVRVINVKVRFPLNIGKLFKRKQEFEKIQKRANKVKKFKKKIINLIILEFY